jgi:hypothetical protein
MNNAKTTFVLASGFMAKSTAVYLNGMRLRNGEGFDYKEMNGNTLVLTEAPWIDDIITVDYIKVQ